jgi:hypothetical protein
MAGDSLHSNPGEHPSVYSLLPKADAGHGQAAYFRGRFRIELLI